MTLVPFDWAVRDSAPTHILLTSKLKKIQFSEAHMHIHSGNKKTPMFDSDEAYQLEIASMQNDENIDFDDALDDDNENPVSHTLVDAAENSGPEEIPDTQELEGEEQESKDRMGRLSQLYKKS